MFCWMLLWGNPLSWESAVAGGIALAITLGLFFSNRARSGKYPGGRDHDGMAALRRAGGGRHFCDCQYGKEKGEALMPDIYDWILSPEIREYLRGTYRPNLMEKQTLIRSAYCSIEEKLSALRELLHEAESVRCSLTITPTAGRLRLCLSSKKMYMGLKSLMVRSAKAIDKLLIILSLAHFFFTAFFDILLPWVMTFVDLGLFCAFCDFAQFKRFRVIYSFKYPVIFFRND